MKAKRRKFTAGFKAQVAIEGTCVFFPSVNGDEKVMPINEWLRKR